MQVAANQHELDVTMAQDITSGRTAVFQRQDNASSDQGCSSQPTNIAIANAAFKIHTLENFLHGSNQQVEEYAQLLSGSVSSVCTMEQYVSIIRRTMALEDEYMANATIVDDGLQSFFRTAHCRECYCAYSTQHA